MEPLLPLLDRRLIEDSYANRPLRDSQRAVARLQYFMRRLPAQAYAMQCDIASYFPSIDRRILFNIIKSHVGRLETGLLGSTLRIRKKLNNGPLTSLTLGSRRAAFTASQASNAFSVLRYGRSTGRQSGREAKLVWLPSS